jgi:hypothetical protein
MSTIWLNGRMSAKEWKETHRREYLDTGEDAVVDPSAPGDRSGAARPGRSARGAPGKDSSHERPDGGDYGNRNP